VVSNQVFDYNYKYMPDARWMVAVARS